MAPSTRWVCITSSVCQNSSGRIWSSFRLTFLPSGCPTQRPCVSAREKVPIGPAGARVLGFDLALAGATPVEWKVRRGEIPPRETICTLRFQTL